MKNENFNGQNISVKHWYLNLALGIILLLVSVWVFINPEITNNSLAIVFSVTLILTGVLEIISSIQYRDILSEWSLSFTIGVLDLLVSISIIVIMVISQPQISTEALTLIVGYVFFYRSVKLINWSTELKNYAAISWGWVIVGTILSFLLIWDRSFTRLSFLFFTNFGLLIIGISEIYFSNTLRKINHKIA